MTIRKNKQEELRGLSRRLDAKGRDVNFRSLEQIGRYRQLAEDVKQGPALDDALIERGLLLLNQGRLCEALLSYEERLQKSPLEFTAQRGWLHLRSVVHDEMLKIAEVDPECAEFGRTYERLLELGSVSNRLHMGAVRCYLASGQVEKATERLLALAKVCPGAPGVTELIIRLAEVSDNVEIQKMSIKMKEEE